jgi:predicted  nucleic acid-binding Zn-ribbon protein
MTKKKPKEQKAKGRSAFELIEDLYSEVDALSKKIQLWSDTISRLDVEIDHIRRKLNEKKWWQIWK